MIRKETKDKSRTDKRLIQIVMTDYLLSHVYDSAKKSSEELASASAKEKVRKIYLVRTLKAMVVEAQKEFKTGM